MRVKKPNKRVYIYSNQLLLTNNFHPDKRKTLVNIPISIQTNKFKMTFPAVSIPTPHFPDFPGISEVYLLNGQEFKLKCVVMVDYNEVAYLKMMYNASKLKDPRFTERKTLRKSIGKGKSLKDSLTKELTIKNITVDDSGDYVCNVTKDEFNFEKNSIRVHVFGELSLNINYI